MTEHNIEIFGLRFSIYNPGTNSETKKAYPGGIKITKGETYVRLSALELAGIWALKDNSDIRKEVAERVKIEKAAINAVSV